MENPDNYEVSTSDVEIQYNSRKYEIKPKIVFGSNSESKVVEEFEQSPTYIKTRKRKAILDPMNK